VNRGIIGVIIGVLVIIILVIVIFAADLARGLGVKDVSCRLDGDGPS